MPCLAESARRAVGPNIIAPEKTFPKINCELEKYLFLIRTVEILILSRDAIVNMVVVDLKPKVSPETICINN